MDYSWPGSLFYTALLTSSHYRAVVSGTVSGVGWTMVADIFICVYSTLIQCAVDVSRYLFLFFNWYRAGKYLGLTALQCLSFYRMVGHRCCSVYCTRRSGNQPLLIRISVFGVCFFISRFRYLRGFYIAGSGKVPGVVDVGLLWMDVFYRRLVTTRDYYRRRFEFPAVLPN